MNTIFVLLLALYFVVGVKIDQWITCSLIGLRLETPLYFMTRPRIYDVVRMTIFAATTVSLAAVTFPWYFGLAALASAWFATTWIGQTLAFNSYRKVAKYLADTSETEEERATYLEDVKKSNAELRDMAMFMNKFGG